MQTSLEAVMKRGEDFETLKEKTEETKVLTHNFYNRTKKLNKRRWWQICPSLGRYCSGPNDDFSRGCVK